jgi:hypothetical protein
MLGQQNDSQSRDARAKAISMATNFVLEGVLEHVVKTNVEFKLKVTDDNSKPCDPGANQKVSAWLKGARENYTVSLVLSHFICKFLKFRRRSKGRN